jgi:glycosyltransferase involved in cell wall biosynthesis
MTPRIAFIVQRCGQEVNGGAEVLCLKIAQRMSAYWNTEVLTTCAVDYMTWTNHYPAGTDKINGILVRRFPVTKERDVDLFNLLSTELRHHANTTSLEKQEKWMEAQGPCSPALIAHIAEFAAEYDGFFFFTYLYAQTYFGLPVIAHKAVLVPLAHDEWTIYLNMWDKFFELPKGFVFNTIEERDFLRQRFKNSHLQGPVIGVAVDRPKDINPLRFRTEFDIRDSFLLYVGRIDPSKGCHELFDYFMRHRQDGKRPEKLVLLGKSMMDIPKHPDIISLGFVSEQTKWDALATCEVLVMPSLHESLSMVLLEAWAVGKPVLVNGHCAVLVGQCKRANGGVWYEDFEGFSVALDILLRGGHRQTLGKQGYQFVSTHYTWQAIEQAYLQCFEELMRPNGISS